MKISSDSISHLRNSLAERFESLFVAVASKSFTHAELIDRVMHRGDDRWRQRLGHVADAAANQTPGRFRIRRAKFGYPASDLGKKIAGLELQVIVV
jgi:hypothetical protein